MGPDAMILVFWMLSFKPPFSLSSFTFIKRLFNSSLFCHKGGVLLERSKGYCLFCLKYIFSSIQFSQLSSQSCPTLCDPLDCSTPGLPVHPQLPEFTQTRVHWVSDTIQPSHPLSSPSAPTFSLSQHQGLFQWVSSLHEVIKVLEFQLQHQSFQWTPRTDLLQGGLVGSSWSPGDSQESSPTP